jgi:hypothetical protein
MYLRKTQKIKIFFSFIMKMVEQLSNSSQLILPPGWAWNVQGKNGLF